MKIVRYSIGSKTEYGILDGEQAREFIGIVENAARNDASRSEVIRDGLGDPRSIRECDRSNLHALGT